MRTVELFYNPYIESAKLIVDGKEYNQRESRMNEFIVNQPINNWLSPYVSSYHRWDGLLAELIEEFNDDEISLFFYSVPTYFQRVMNELNSQAEYIERRGYYSEFWKCECIERYLPEKMKAGIMNFIHAKKHFVPDQFTMNLFEYSEQRLEQSDMTVELLAETYTGLKKAVDAALAYCMQKKANSSSIRVWENAERELQKVFGSAMHEGT